MAQEAGSVQANTFVQKACFNLGPWTIETTKSHILESSCQQPDTCKARSDSRCSVCRYKHCLKLPHLPEMVFPDNKLRLVHDGKFGLEFNALDALRLVDPEHDVIKVSATEAWRDARMGSEYLNTVVRPYDWTFTTHYRGTLLAEDPEHELKVQETKERIDLEKLKVKEPIKFFDEIVLFEDELHDHGTSHLQVKIRVMPGKFFILLRFFLRVDNVLVRTNDTRLYHEEGKNHIIREYTSKEKKIEDLQVPLDALCNPVAIQEHLNVVEEIYEKLEFPSPSS